MPSESENLGEKPRRKGRRARILSYLAGALLVAAGAGVLLYLGGRNGEATETGAADAEQEGEEKTGEKKEGEENGKTPIPVRVDVAAAGPISSYISATANLVAENEVKILAEAEGRVSQFLAEEGDYVRAGQVLATLVRDDAEIAVEKARLSETNARLTYERAEDLVGKELISRESYDDLKIKHGIAQQGLAEAEWRLSKTTIRSPFNGKVSQRLIQVGQHVRLGNELFQITDLDPLIARIYLPEKDVLGLSEGREVRITLNAAPDVRFAGRIRQISPVVDTETGTIKLTIEAASPPPDVRPGSFVTIDIVRETHPRAVLLPRGAVIRELQKAHVFVANLQGIAEKRPVTLGLEEKEWIEVLAGVQEGDRVIVAGQGGLKDGSSVKVLDGEEG